MSKVFQSSTSDVDSVALSMNITSLNLEIIDLLNSCSLVAVATFRGAVSFPTEQGT